MNSEDNKVGIKWFKNTIKNEKRKEKFKLMNNLSYLITILALIYFLSRVFYSL